MSDKATCLADIIRHQKRNRLIIDLHHLSELCDSKWISEKRKIQFLETMEECRNELKEVEK